MSAKSMPPDSYAYRYHDCIRFNHGQTVNGGNPIEAIPLYFDSTVDLLLLEAEVATLRRAALRVDALIGTGPIASPVPNTPERLERDKEQRGYMNAAIATIRDMLLKMSQEKLEWKEKNIGRLQSHASGSRGVDR